MDLFEEAVDGVLREDCLYDMTVGGVDGVGGGSELAQEVFLLHRAEELTYRDGSSASQGQRQAPMDGLGRKCAAIGCGSQQVLKQLLRIETFETRGDAEDADSAATKVAEVETQRLEVGLHGSKGGGVGG